MRVRIFMRLMLRSHSYNVVPWYATILYRTHKLQKRHCFHFTPSPSRIVRMCGTNVCGFVQTPTHTRNRACAFDSKQFCFFRCRPFVIMQNRYNVTGPPAAFNTQSNNNRSTLDENASTILRGYFGLLRSRRKQMTSLLSTRKYRCCIFIDWTSIVVAFRVKRDAIEIFY